MQGIAPALILVRVGLSASIDNVEEAMTSFRAEVHDISLRSRSVTYNVGLGNPTFSKNSLV